MQVIKHQMELDQNVLKLIGKMRSLYSFVQPLESLKNEDLSLLLPLENMVQDILIQTVECVLFVQAYNTRSSVGAYAPTLETAFNSHCAC